MPEEATVQSEDTAQSVVTAATGATEVADQQSPGAKETPEAGKVEAEPGEQQRQIPAKQVSWPEEARRENARLKAAAAGLQERNKALKDQLASRKSVSVPQLGEPDEDGDVPLLGTSANLPKPVAELVSQMAETMEGLQGRLDQIEGGATASEAAENETAVIANLESGMLNVLTEAFADAPEATRNDHIEDGRLYANDYVDRLAKSGEIKSVYDITEEHMVAAAMHAINTVRAKTARAGEAQILANQEAKDKIGAQPGSGLPATLAGKTLHDLSPKEQREVAARAAAAAVAMRGS